MFERTKEVARELMEHRRRFTVLLLMIVLLLLLAPVVTYLPWARILFPALSAFIPLAAIYAVSDNKRHQKIALMLGIPATFGAAAHLTEFGFTGEWAILFLPPLFYGFTVFVVSVKVFSARRITADMLSGAACIYLLIGMTWWFFYLVLETLAPGAIGGRAPGLASAQQRFELLYFSFVTLTTLGYGDMLPQMRIAQSLAIIEAITGVLYSGILIAKLVGTYAGQAKADDHQTDQP